jgi:hypothetical protein
VPLSWYHSTTYSFFPDETHSLIRRVYTHPTQQHSKRHFCGYCGTPLSYWSEEPYSEADFINLTLGSLLRQDLADLEDMGLIPDQSDGDDSPPAATTTAVTGGTTTTDTPMTVTVGPTRNTALRESYGVPWFDGLVEGTRLGRMRRAQGIQRSRDGKVKIEWEVVEYADDGTPQDRGEEEDVEMGSSTPGKRKLEDVEAPEAGRA